jgi:hypothetical protein
MRTLALLVFSISFAAAVAGEPIKGPNEPSQQKMQSGLAVHVFRDPQEWDGHWKEGQKPDVSPKDWTFRHYVSTSTDSVINHLFIHHGWFSVRWVGWLEVPEEKGTFGGTEAADVTLELWMDDGARLFVDGQKLVDDWRPCWELSKESHRIATTKLAPGYHRLVVEYFQGESLEKKDNDPAKLFWTCPALKIPRQPIPASHFSHTDADLRDYVPSQGLSAEDGPRLDGGKAAPEIVKGTNLPDKPEKRAK